MNKQLRHNFKVGLFFVLSLAFIAVSLLFLRGKLNSDKHFKVIFDNARGLKSGETVQMAGVDIGQVDSVRVTDNNQAALSIGIRKDIRIPVGSRFRITSGILGNNRTLVVDPNSQNPTEIADGTTVTGDPSSALDDTIVESQKLIKQGQELVASFNKIAGDPAMQRSLKRTVDNTAEITQNLKVVTAQLPRLQAQVDSLVVDLHSTLASGKRIAAQAEQLTSSAQGLATDARGLTADARKIAQNVNGSLLENRNTLKSLLRSADDAASAVAGLTTDLRRTVGNPKLAQNLEDATNNLVAISNRLEIVAGDVQRLSGDPRLAADIRETVGNLKETSASVKNLTSRVEALRLPGEKRRPEDGTSGSNSRPPRAFSATSLLEPGFALDSTYDTKVERLRVDANYTLLTGSKGRFYRAGLFDVTEGNHPNLQVGQSIGTPARFDYRYGLVAGKFGLGFDARTGPLDLRFDFYDPNRFQINARAKAYLNRDTSLFGGVDSLGKDNRATLGVQIRK